MVSTISSCEQYRCKQLHKDMNILEVLVEYVVKKAVYSYIPKIQRRIRLGITIVNDIHSTCLLRRSADICHSQGIEYESLPIASQGIDRFGSAFGLGLIRLEL